MTRSTFPPSSKLTAWQPIGRQKFNFYPCHVENVSFEKATELFVATASKFKATKSAPRAGQHFMLQLVSGRRALLTSYADFPKSIEISLELSESDDGEEVAHLSDLVEILNPLECPIPDKSSVGFPTWRE